MYDVGEHMCLRFLMALDGPDLRMVGVQEFALHRTTLRQSVGEAGQEQDAFRSHFVLNAVCLYAVCFRTRVLPCSRAPKWVLISPGSIGRDVT